MRGRQLNGLPRNEEGRTSLVAHLGDELRRQIMSGKVPVGQKLPSEAALTEEFNVSRTVVREAVASLRADGLVQARQGSGVFVVARDPVSAPAFPSVDPSRISSVIEFLELRSAIEVEAAGLASQRRSPAQEEAIIEGCEEIERLMETGQPTSDADFRLHLSIADATNNARFREFLGMIGSQLIPRRALQDGASDAAPAHYLEQIQAEHRMIATSIAMRDETSAREAMRQHLTGSQTRYRQLLRRA